MVDLSHDLHQVRAFLIEEVNIRSTVGGTTAGLWLEIKVKLKGRHLIII